MRIEEGKSYRAANGEKIDPVEHWWGNTDRVRHLEGDGKYWFLDGTGGGDASGNDLVAEWAEGPVRTVARQEIIPGTYDGVSVMGQNRRLCRVAIIPSLLDADELDRAAAVLTALAGALRDA